MRFWIGDTQSFMVYESGDRGIISLRQGGILTGVRTDGITLSTPVARELYKVPSAKQYLASMSGFMFSRSLSNSQRMRRFPGQYNGNGAVGLRTISGLLFAAHTNQPASCSASEVGVPERDSFAVAQDLSV